SRDGGCESALRSASCQARRARARVASSGGENDRGGAAEREAQPEARPIDKRRVGRQRRGEPTASAGARLLELLPDLVRLLVLELESLLPLGRGPGRVALLLGEVPEVLVDRRVVGVVVGGDAQMLLGEIELSEAEVDPAERVLVSPVAGIPRDGPLEHLA